MMDDPELALGVDIKLQEILLAASKHNAADLRGLFRTITFVDCEPWDAQDPETGFTPLHAAIASCEPDDDLENLTNGEHDAAESKQAKLTKQCAQTVRMLLQEGSIWNQVDKNGETPGCMALRLGLREIYEIMVDAGVRAELLLNRMDDYEPLADPEETAQTEADHDAQGLADEVAEDADSDPTGNVDSKQYLTSSLSFAHDKILDESSNGVMMVWESDIMKSSADALLTEFEPGVDLRVLNIGFGLGIIDTFIQEHGDRIVEHHIVEAHPAVLADMKEKGWYDKTNVRIHEGKWQDVLWQLVAEGKTFHAIFFDTFAESYIEFKTFFSESVIGLLEEGGKWSFFNGMGADRQISYDVYQKVVEIDLMEAGFDVDWEVINVPQLGGQWEGVKRKYWNVDKYRLPVCKFMG